LAEHFELEPAHPPGERYTVRLETHREPVVERRT
jgi:hypothetical protein